MLRVVYVCKSHCAFSCTACVLLYAFVAEFVLIGVSFVACTELLASQVGSVLLSEPGICHGNDFRGNENQKWRKKKYVAWKKSTSILFFDEN